MKRLILFILCALALTSCSAMINSMQESKLTEKTYLSLEVIQTLSDTSGIAVTKDYKVVRIDSLEGMMYDGKKFSGTFVLVGTYTYEANNGVVKTIPRYVNANELKRYKQEHGLAKTMGEEI